MHLESAQPLHSYDYQVNVLELLTLFANAKLYLTGSRAGCDLQLMHTFRHTTA